VEISWEPGAKRNITTVRAASSLPSQSPNQ
jgi:hypothetical protein